MHDQLIIKHFSIGYKVWLPHEERIEANVTNETILMLQKDNERILANNLRRDMANDAFGYHQYSNVVMDDREMSVESSHTMNDDIEDFVELMQDGQESLYEGYDRYFKLSFLIKLYQIICLCKISDKAMSMIHSC